MTAMSMYLAHLDRWVRERPQVMLWGALCLFLVLGLYEINGHPVSMEDGQTDNFWPLANHLLDGQGYTLCYPLYFPFCPQGDATPTAMREPLPTLLFAGAAAISGRSLWFALHIQLLLGLATVWLLHRFTLRLAGARAAALATLAWAAYLPFVMLHSQLSGDVTGTFMILLSAVVLQQAERTGALKHYLLAGATLGLAALSRSSMLLMALPWCAVAWRSARGERMRPAIVRMVAIGATMAVVLAPWALRNHAVFGRWWLGTSMNGYNVFRMNYQVGTDEPLHYVDSFEADTMLHDLLARHPELTGEENEAAMDKVYQAEGMAQIRKAPLKYMRLCGYRFFQLFTNIGVKTTYGVELNTTDHVMLVQQLAYLALAFTGIAWGFRAHWPWLLAIGVQVAGYTALVAQGRYLTPVMPLLIAFAGLALDRLIGRTRSADR